MTYARLYRYDTFLERLAPYLEDMAAELWPFIQEEPAVVCPRHVAWQRHVAAPISPTCVHWR